ncbi:kinesin-like protein KIN-13B [Pyrus x bretschneideri]|uniref:kinesin-like protein KIN-13B n=1 Tax=Pyrus x bretschneideri TaxID=225117 RepID=UPI00202F42BA|nr:kinesin-like protein KIN-13B [Pyrus x bretschneideri]
MNAVGRQMSRSSSSMHHHRRQYSDHFTDAPSKWLQSTSLSQDFELYGTRMSRQSYRNGNERSPPDASTPPPIPLRSSSMRRNGDDRVSPSELSPGLLDINSFDTELLPEATSRSRILPENSLLKSFSADKERGNTSNVAKIKVVVRKRPLNKKEFAKKEEDIITIEPHSNALTVHETKLKVDLTGYVEKHEFVFDAVLNEDVSNDEVYFETVEPIVPLIFQRTKATCFAYGQTGSGKTYTMQPLPLKASQDILRLTLDTYRNQGFQLFVSFFEIYGGKLFDLLNDRKKLCMREDGKQQVCIVGLQEYRVSNVETVREFIEKGNSTRSTGTTGANEESSRSHAILQLCVKRSADGTETKPARLVGKLSFIDLAGSERGADTTDNDKQTRMEGAEINKSLLALKECIRALDSDQGHIPFRGSKLTEVLRDSFVGDSRTVMISCISPSSGSCEHTLNTLRYADRVKSLSKGGGSKRHQLTSLSNLRDSTTMPLSSSLPNDTTFEDDMTYVPTEQSSFGWSKQITEREPSAKMNADRIPSGRAEGNFSTSVSNYYKAPIGGRNGIGKDDFDYPEQTYEQAKPSRGNSKKVETYQQSALEEKRKIGSQMKWTDIPDIEAMNSHSEDDLNAVLQEEEDLVTAHRRQVEHTIDIVREEMNLLVQADQPGNPIDDYICKLNAILSQKAAGILQLQAQLAQFQRHLNDHSVLVSSSSSSSN